MDEQTFEEYKSKYLDLHQKVKMGTGKEKESILNDVDFELELIARDEINVAYIIRLLAALKGAKPAELATKRAEISKLLASEVQLRSKRELIERFIVENLPHVANADAVPQSFDDYVQAEREKELAKLAREENAELAGLQKLANDYLFTERLPNNDQITKVLIQQPRLLERQRIAERIRNKIADWVETFIDGMPGVG